MASCHALRCYMVAPTASSLWRWIIQMLSFLWRLLQFFLFKQTPTLYFNTSTQGCACPHADCKYKLKMARKSVPLYWICGCISRIWTLFWTHRFNLTFWTYLSLHLFLIDELNIINLLLLYACFLLAGDLLLSFYFTGILLLGEILSRISFKCLDVNTITTLSDFFISRLVSLMLWLCESWLFPLKYFPRSFNKYKKDGRERSLSRGSIEVFSVWLHFSWTICWHVCIYTWY